MSLLGKHEYNLRHVYSLYQIQAQKIDAQNSALFLENKKNNRSTLKVNYI